MNARPKSDSCCSRWGLPLLRRCCAAPPAHAAPRAGLDRIQHIVVIYAENRSFDHLYGLFPGANGLASADAGAIHAGRSRRQAAAGTAAGVEGQGRPIPRSPSGCRTARSSSTRPPLNLPLSQQVRSPVHKYYQNIEQIDGGRNDRFAAVSDAGGYTMALLRRVDAAAVAVGEGILARRPILHGGVRRLLPQSPLARSARARRATRTRRRACARRSTSAAGSGASRNRRRRRSRATSSSSTANSRRTAIRSTRRSRRISRPACRRQRTATRASPVRRRYTLAAADEEDDRRHAVGERHHHGPGMRAAGTRP